MRGYDDGQEDDGENVGWVEFQPRTPAAGQPWLANPLPPWHLWGNSQRLDLLLSSGTFSQQVNGQMSKVAYGRPDTWHWLFTARLLAASTPPVGTDLNIQINWELTVGIGRSTQQDLGFDSWNIALPGGVAPPIGRLIWTTETIATNPNRNPLDPAPPPNFIREIVAQDIQLNVRAAITLGGAAVGYPYTATLELGAQWAPKSHIRPDWQQHGAPREVQFPGAEVPAR